MPQTPVDNTQASLPMTQAFVTAGVFPPRFGAAGGAFLDEIVTFAFTFAPPGGTISANGQVLPIAQNTAAFSIIGTTYGGNGTTNFAIPNLGGVTMIGTGQGPGLSPANLGVREGTSSMTLTPPELPPDLGGTSQPFNNYQPSLPVTYMICAQGVFPTQTSGADGQDLIGEVKPFAGNYVPIDYLPADGSLVPIAQYTALFNVIGTLYGGDGVTTFALPDLRGRTIIGVSTTDPLGTLVGSPTVSLSNNQTPNGLGNTVQPFDNREPSLALNYLIALDGIFPSINSGNVVDPNTPFLGEVMPFAGTFAPAGWALCDGQLLPINQYQALFSLLGTTYGGDGRTNFALPDLRDRTVVGTGGSAVIGSQLGANFTTVTAAELPTPNADYFVAQESKTGDMIYGYVYDNNGRYSVGSTYTSPTDQFGGSWTYTVNNVVPVTDVAHLQSRSFYNGRVYDQYYYDADRGSLYFTDFGYTGFVNGAPTDQTNWSGSNWLGSDGDYAMINGTQQLFGFGNYVVSEPMKADYFIAQESKTGDMIYGYVYDNNGRYSVGSTVTFNDQLGGTWTYTVNNVMTVTDAAHANSYQFYNGKVYDQYYYDADRGSLYFTDFGYSGFVNGAPTDQTNYSGSNWLGSDGDYAMINGTQQLFGFGAYVVGEGLPFGMSGSRDTLGGSSAASSSPDPQAAQMVQAMASFPSAGSSPATSPISDTESQLTPPPLVVGQHARG